jgi:hypothetical protein
MHDDDKQRVKLPRTHHTALKLWATAHEMTAQKALTLAVEKLVGDVERLRQLVQAASEEG